MRVLWSLPVRGEGPSSGRGDLVRARRLGEALRSLGHELEVVADASTAAARLRVGLYRRWVRRLVPERVALVLRDTLRTRHARFHAGRVIAAARRRGAEVLIETQVGFAASGARAAAATGLPLILDDCVPASEEELLGVGRPHLARRILEQQLERAVVATVSSSQIAACLVRAGTPAEKVRVIPNGVDLAAFDGIDRDAARQRRGLGDRCVLVFVGSLQPWHRIDLLLAAMETLVEAHPVHLMLVGDGAERGPALEQIRRLGLGERVTAPGSVPHQEIPELLRVADIGVLPGSNEYGQPMKLLEYAAARLPVVAPDLAPVRDVVTHDRHGLLFEPGDPGSLLRALLRQVADPHLRQRQGSAARREIAATASWSDRGRLLEEELVRAVEAARAPNV